VVPQSLVVDSVGIVNASIVFSHSHKSRPLFSEILAGPVPHVSEALHDEGLSLEADLDLQLLGDALVVEQLLGAGEDAEACGFGPAADAELVEVLASGDCIAVDVLISVKGLIGRFHPTHLSLACSHIGPGDVDCSSDRVLLGQSDGVGASERFEFSGGVFAGVDADAALRASVGEVDDGALDAHEAGECFHFLYVHVLGVASASLGGQLVGLVLAAVGRDGFE